MPGPLPKPEGQRRRRNAPTTPTTMLPASGRRGRPPTCPYDLGKSGTIWWKWAWSTPQAAGWSKGNLYAIARRAQLEDDLGGLEGVSGALDLDRFVGEASLDGLGEAIESVKALIARLKGLATSKVTLIKEMRELDDRLGLTPKGMAALHWVIVEETKADVASIEEGKERRRLKAVDSSAVAGA